MCWITPNISLQHMLHIALFNWIQFTWLIGAWNYKGIVMCQAFSFYLAVWHLSSLVFSFVFNFFNISFLFQVFFFFFFSPYCVLSIQKCILEEMCNRKWASCHNMRKNISVEKHNQKNLFQLGVDNNLFPFKLPVLSFPLDFKCHIPLIFAHTAWLIKYANSIRKKTVNHTHWIRIIVWTTTTSPPDIGGHNNW